VELTRRVPYDKLVTLEKGDFMKKVFMLVIALSVIGIFISCDKMRDVAQSASDEQKAPEKQQTSNQQQASNKPEFHVIDSQSKRGGLEDRVRLNNKTSRTGISFTVYLRDPSDNKWKVYGTGNLKGPGDTEFISAKISGNLKGYRYFAIQSNDTRDYRYDFEKTHNDLYIYIYDK